MGVRSDLRSHVWSLQVGACPWGGEEPDGDRSCRRSFRTGILLQPRWDWDRCGVSG